MEKEEINLDDIFDLKPIIPEIYTYHDHHPFSDKSRISDHIGSRRSNNSISRSSYHPQETTSHVISSSIISPTAAVASASKVISFENSDHMDYNSNLDQMIAEDHSLTSEIINFSSSAKDDSGDSVKGINQERLSTAIARSPFQAQEHLMAERKRRQNLTQLFINLSKVVPGLKKLDKASLLEDGINYLKALQERVRVLEEEEMKKSSTDTSSSSSSCKESCSDYSTGITGESSAPEIQARISDKHVLIKVFCKKQMELVSRIPGEMEKMHLNVVDIRIMPFGGAALDITILAEMQSEFKGTVKDIVARLHTVFLNPTTS